jgi:hypothetical protein
MIKNINQKHLHKRFHSLRLKSSLYQDDLQAGYQRTSIMIFKNYDSIEGIEFHSKLNNETIIVKPDSIDVKGNLATIKWTPNKKGQYL